jgi:hypothetical protein
MESAVELCHPIKTFPNLPNVLTKGRNRFDPFARRTKQTADQPYSSMEPRHAPSAFTIHPQTLFQ